MPPGPRPVQYAPQITLIPLVGTRLCLCGAHWSLQMPWDILLLWGHPGPGPFVRQCVAVARGTPGICDKELPPLLDKIKAKRQRGSLCPSTQHRDTVKALEGSRKIYKDLEGPEGSEENRALSVPCLYLLTGWITSFPSLGLDTGGG